MNSNNDETTDAPTFDRQPHEGATVLIRYKSNRSDNTLTVAGDVTDTRGGRSDGSGPYSLTVTDEEESRDIIVNGPSAYVKSRTDSRTTTLGDLIEVQVLVEADETPESWEGRRLKDKEGDIATVVEHNTANARLTVEYEDARETHASADKISDLIEEDEVEVIEETLNTESDEDEDEDTDPDGDTPTGEETDEEPDIWSDANEADRRIFGVDSADPDTPATPDSDTEDEEAATDGGHETEEVGLTDLDEEDLILYDGRKKPCEVAEATIYDGPTVTPGKWVVETPRGKERHLNRAQTAGVNPRVETDKHYQETRPDSSTWVNYFNDLRRVVDSNSDTEDAGESRR